MKILHQLQRQKLNIQLSITFTSFKIYLDSLLHLFNLTDLLIQQPAGFEKVKRQLNFLEQNF